MWEAMPELLIPRFLLQAEARRPARVAWVLGSVGVAVGLMVLVFVAMHGA